MWRYPFSGTVWHPNRRPLRLHLAQKACQIRLRMTHLFLICLSNKMPFAAALQTHLDAGVGIEVVAQGIPEEVEAEYGEGHGEGGEENEVRRVEKVGAGVVEH